MKESRLEWKLKKTCIVAIILLIVGAGLASSGVCQSEGFELTEQKLEEEPEERKLTTEDLGLLILSALFMKDKQQRQFVFKVVSQLQKEGTLTEDEVQSIADNQGRWTPKIFLASKVEADNWNIILPIPGIVGSFFERIPTASVLISDYGYLKVNDVNHHLAIFNFIGFVGNVHNHPTERDSSVWQYEVEGYALMTIALLE